MVYYALKMILEKDTEHRNKKVLTFRTNKFSIYDCTGKTKNVHRSLKTKQELSNKTSKFIYGKDFIQG